uniref:Uncharacterized protein n=1 Tax=Panagrolaimus superbus TaxID=310955 RepID=A0A914YBN6_9BILA
MSSSSLISQEDLNETASNYSLSSSKSSMKDNNTYIRSKNDYLYGCGIVGALNVEESDAEIRIQQTNSENQRIPNISPEYIGFYGPSILYNFPDTNSVEESNHTLQQIQNGNPNNITYHHFDEFTDDLHLYYVQENFDEEQIVPSINNLQLKPKCDCKWSFKTFYNSLKNLF